GVAPRRQLDGGADEGDATRVLGTIDPVCLQAPPLAREKGLGEQRVVAIAPFQLLHVRAETERKDPRRRAQLPPSAVEEYFLDQHAIVDLADDRARLVTELALIDQRHRLRGRRDAEIQTLRDRAIARYGGSECKRPAGGRIPLPRGRVIHVDGQRAGAE